MFTAKTASIAGNYYVLSPTVALATESVAGDGPLPRRIAVAIWPEGRAMKNRTQLSLDPISVAGLPLATDADKALLIETLGSLVATRGLQSE
jgi:hypothetical protein